MKIVVISLPKSGTYLLDKLKTQDVWIFGFDWKQSPTTTTKPNKRIITKQNDHDYESEKLIALELIEKNHWKLFS